VNVKPPSEKLQIMKGFTVGDGQNVSFVFDITVFRAGNSGKYILKPVIGESGTGDEVDIDDVDEREADDEDDEGNETDADGEDGLTAEFQGPVRPGEDATVKVTGEEGPVEGATVAVNGEDVGTTGASGTVTFGAPADAEEIEVDVRKGGAEAELEHEFEDGESPALPAPA
jgi:hypothetical protein